ncbi:hypothetical protein EDB19DRAFT_1831430 [Suillus lakei]|nr:hypothetical protein EDB19DRAFT_1831430 [Suillus lakei]
MTVSTDKLDAFGDYLGTSSQAEVWFQAIPSTSKATWATFVTVFEACWPPVKIVEKTKAEYEKELLDHALQCTEVGKKMTLYDWECWTHIAWAVKTFQLATSVGIAQSMSMIWQVRSTLPDIVKDLLKDEEYADWAEFAKAVMELKGSRLAEKQEQHNWQVQEISTLKQTSLAFNNEQQHLTQLMHSKTNSAKLITDELKASIRLLVAAFPHHPDTPAGNAAHTAHIAQWNVKRGESTRVTHEMGYPLVSDQALAQEIERKGIRGTKSLPDQTEKCVPGAKKNVRRYQNSKEKWTVDVKQQNTPTQSLKNKQAGIKVLACEEARCKDEIRTNSPELSAEHVAKNNACSIEFP